jgi:hypothetical protein
MKRIITPFILILFLHIVGLGQESVVNFRVISQDVLEDNIKRGTLLDRRVTFRITNIADKPLILYGSKDDNGSIYPLA